MTRPPLLVVVAGTGTGVGKTWVTAALLRELKSNGLRVSVRKPVQSFDPGDDVANRTDADALSRASGESIHHVCPPHRWYPIGMAPPMAANALGRPGFTVAELAAELSWAPGELPPRPVDIDVGFVEMAGGVRSPIADDGDTVSLCTLLAPDLVVLVADAGLGTINSVRLSTDALTGFATVVLLNRWVENTELHERNLAWLRERCALECLVSTTSLAERVIDMVSHAGPGSVPRRASK